MDGFAEGRGSVDVLFVDVLILNLCTLDFRKKGLDLGASNSVVGSQDPGLGSSRPPGGGCESEAVVAWERDAALVRGPRSRQRGQLESEPGAP